MHKVLRDDRAGKAISWLLLGLTGGLCLDLCAKELLQTYPLVQFVLLRSLAGLCLFLALAPVFGGWRRLVTRHWRWHLVRTILAAGAMFGFFFGLARMPLVSTLTLGFTAPLMLTALSMPLLGERVGWRRWLAVLVGFAGVLVVLRPGADFPVAPALAVLAAAFCYACLAISARHLGHAESSYALAIYVIAGPLLISATLTSNVSWISPGAADWILFGVAGACSVVAWLGITNGYRLAAPALLAPFEYTTLVGGALAGYFFWDEVPDPPLLAGAALIIGSGLYVIYREVGPRKRDGAS